MKMSDFLKLPDNKKREIQVAMLKKAAKASTDLEYWDVVE